MLELDARNIVELESFVGKSLLPDDDLDLVLPLQVNQLVENTVDACGLEELALVDRPEIFEAVFVL